MKNKLKVFALILAIIALILSGCSKQAEKKEVKQPKEKFEVTVEKQEAPNFILSSQAFKDGGSIPVKYCMSQISGGKNISLPLQWTDPPAGTKSFALICYDKHPIANNWIHWLVVDIPPNVRSFEENASGTEKMSGARELFNTFGFKGWGGPMPPEGSGVHEYEFHIYALAVEKLDVPERLTLEEFLNAMQGKVIAEAKLTGIYKR